MGSTAEKAVTATEYAGTTSHNTQGTETQFQLIWMAFKAHRLAVISLFILMFLYFIAAFAEFLAPNDPHKVNARYTYAPAQELNLFENSDEDGWVFRPHVFGYKVEVDPIALRRTFVTDYEKKFYIQFLPKPTRQHYGGCSPSSGI